MEIILGMDHNYDLLKMDTHKLTEEFLDLMINSEIWADDNVPHENYPNICYFN